MSEYEDGVFSLPEILTTVDGFRKLCERSEIIDLPTSPYQIGHGSLVFMVGNKMRSGLH